MTDIAAFTYRSARSGSLTAGLSLAVAVETMVVHLWLVQRHPGLTWGLVAGTDTLGPFALVRGATPQLFRCL